LVDALDLTPDLLEVSFGFILNGLIMVSELDCHLFGHQAYQIAGFRGGHEIDSRPHIMQLNCLAWRAGDRAS
jgi:hypothetical protein